MSYLDNVEWLLSGDVLLLVSLLLLLLSLGSHHLNRQVGPGRAKQLLMMGRLPGSVMSDVSLPDRSAGRGHVVEMVWVVVTFRGTDLSDGAGDDLIEVWGQLVQLREIVAVHGDDEGVVRGAGAAVSPVRRTVGGGAGFVLWRRLRREVIIWSWGGRRIGRQVGLLLSAPLQGYWLLDWVRIDELQDTNLLRYDLADLPGGEVGHQLGDQAAVTLGLELAVLHWLLDGGDHRLVPAVLRTLTMKILEWWHCWLMRYLWFYFANVCNLSC